MQRLIRVRRIAAFCLTKAMVLGDYFAKPKIVGAKRQQLMRVVAGCLVCMLIFTGMRVTSTFAETDDSVITITGFSSLPDDIALQYVPVGAGIDCVTFPTTLKAILSTEIEDDPEEIIEEDLEDILEEDLEDVDDTEEPDDTAAEDMSSEDEISGEVIVGEVSEQTEEISEEYAETPEVIVQEIVTEESVTEYVEEETAIEEYDYDYGQEAVEEYIEEYVEPVELETEDVSPIAYLLDMVAPTIVVNAKTLEGTMELPCDWNIDITRSSGAIFDSSEEGATYVYVASAASEYPIISSLPTITVVVSSEATVGAHSYTNSVGDVFLGGHYIEVGVASTGSFGTAAGADDSFHPTTGNSTSGRIGLSVDGDGFDEGNDPTTGDFFLPGIMEERYILSYKIDGVAVNNCNAERMSSVSWLSPQVTPHTVDASNVDSGFLKAITYGTTKDGVRMTMSIYFDEAEKYYTTDVVIENKTGKEITDVRWVRSFDPDQDAEMHGDFSTYNKVISNPNSAVAYTSDQCAMVVAKGGYTKEAFFFAAFDPRARASTGVAFSPSSAYLEGLWKDDSSLPTVVQESNYEGISGYNHGDDAIALTFNCGTLAAGGSTTLSFFSSLDPDISNTFNKLRGKTNYHTDSIDELDAEEEYLVTVNGESDVTYVIKSSDVGDMPLEGTDENGVEYSFYGKTIHIAKSSNPEESTDIFIPRRPEAMDTEQEDDDNPDTEGATTPSEVSTDETDSTKSSISIRIDPTDATKMSQVYRIYDMYGNEIEGYDWVSPNADGTLVFDGLEEGCEYIIKSMIEATDTSFASKISEGIRVRTKGSLILNDKDDVTVTYNGDSRGFFVRPDQEDAKVQYSTDATSPYSDVRPVFTDAGVYKVYYKVTKPGYKTAYGSYTVTIEKAEHGDYTAPEVEIDGKGQASVDFDISKYLNSAQSETVDAAVIRGALFSYLSINDFDNDSINYTIIDTLDGTKGYFELQVSSKNYEDYILTIPLRSKNPSVAKSAATFLEEFDHTRTTPTSTPVTKKVEQTPVVEEKPQETIKTVTKKKTVTKATPVAEPVEELEAGKVSVRMELGDSDKVHAALIDLNAVASAALSEENRKAVDAGSNIEIKVEVNPIDSADVASEDEAKITKGVSVLSEKVENLTIGSYIDISMYLRVDENDWNQITSTEEPVNIVIDIPEDYKGLSEEYYVLRLHEGNITLLTDIDDNPDTVTISTEYFSTYVLMYTMVPEVVEVEPVIVEPVVVQQEPETVTVEKCHLCHKCPTFLGICLFVWLIIAVGVLTFVFSVVFLREDKDDQKEKKPVTAG